MDGPRAFPAARVAASTPRSASTAGSHSGPSSARTPSPSKSQGLSAQLESGGHGHRQCVAVALVRAAFVSRRDLALENAALRQQLAAYHRITKRPRLKPADRLIWAALSKVWNRWQSSLIVVQPAFSAIESVAMKMSSVAKPWILARRA